MRCLSALCRHWPLRSPRSSARSWADLPRPRSNFWNHPGRCRGFFMPREAHMVAIRSRSSWGARAPRSRTTTSWGSRDEVTLHYSYGPESQTVRSIQDHHMDGNGWADIGSNSLVDHKGVAYEGRGWDGVGAHAAPRNTQGIGICFIGRDGMSDAAKATVVALYDEACRRAGRPLDRKWHRALNYTAYPGTKDYQWATSNN